MQAALQMSGIVEGNVRVAIDVSALHSNFKAHGQRGIGRYARELFRAMTSMGVASSVPAVSVHGFNFVDLASPLSEAVVSLFPIGKQTARQQLFYPLSLAKRTSDCDLLHFIAQTDAPAWGLKPYILTVHDLIPLVCEDLYRNATQDWKFRFGRWLELRAIKNAAHIIAVSESTSRDLQRILHVPQERISVTPLGVDTRYLEAAEVAPHEAERIRARAGIPSGRPTVLYVGGIDPRKNTEGLLRTMRIVIDRCREKGAPHPSVVIVGGVASDKEYPRLRARIKELGLEDDVFFTGFVSEEDLIAWYKISTVLFFPTLYEGFGFPALEALAAGLPVVCSNTSSLPEVVGDTARLVDPQDYGQCANTVYEVLTEESLRSELAARGRVRARSFTWNRTAELTLKVYEAVAASRATMRAR